MRKKNKGSVTIEATISLMVIMTVVLTFSSIIRVVHIHSVIQHSLVQTANEIAEYSYFYSLTGIDKLNNTAVSRGQASAETISAGIDEVEHVMNEFSNGKLVSPDMDKLDFKKIISSIIPALLGEVYDQGKSLTINTFVTKPLFKTYLPDNADQYLKENHVENGIDGIDFSYSRYFANSDKDEIEIVAVYNVKFFAPIPIIDKVTIIQSAKARAFFNK